jgi:hypothetical protein
MPCACLLQLGDHLGAMRRNVGNETRLVTVAQPHALLQRLLQHHLLLGQMRHPVGLKVESVVRLERLLPDGAEQRLDEVVAQQAGQVQTVQVQAEREAGCREGGAVG